MNIIINTAYYLWPNYFNLSANLAIDTQIIIKPAISDELRTTSVAIQHPNQRKTRQQLGTRSDTLTRATSAVFILDPTPLTKCHPKLTSHHVAKTSQLSLFLYFFYYNRDNYLCSSEANMRLIYKMRCYLGITQRPSPTLTPISHPSESPSEPRQESSTFAVTTFHVFWLRNRPLRILLNLELRIHSFIAWCVWFWKLLKRIKKKYSCISLMPD